MNNFEEDNNSLAFNFESDDCVFLVPEPMQAHWSKVDSILSSIEFSPESSLEITSMAFRKNCKVNDCNLKENLDQEIRDPLFEFNDNFENSSNLNSESDLFNKDNCDNFHKQDEECMEDQSCALLLQDQEWSLDKYKNMDLTLFNSIKSNIANIESIIDLNPAVIYNKSGSIRKKVGRKIEDIGLSKRKDVVLKCLLRLIRNIIRKHILLNCSICKDDLSLLRENLKTYITCFMDFDPTYPNIDTLASFIFTGQVEELLQKSNEHEQNEEFNKRISVIRETLYRFNFSRFKKMIKLPAMKAIILYFETFNTESLSDDEKIGFQILSEECRRPGTNPA